MCEDHAAGINVLPADHADHAGHHAARPRLRQEGLFWDTFSQWFGVTRASNPPVSFAVLSFRASVFILRYESAATLGQEKRMEHFSP